MTILVAALWAREGRPIDPAVRRVAAAVVGLALLVGIAVHVLVP